MVLDGVDLDWALKAHGIQLTDEEIDEVLTILSNHGKFYYVQLMTLTVIPLPPR